MHRTGLPCEVTVNIFIADFFIVCAVELQVLPLRGNLTVQIEDELNHDNLKRDLFKARTVIFFFVK